MGMPVRHVLPALLAFALTAAAAQIPRPAPELSWISANGQKLELSKYKGKVVVLEILSTTCPHCQFTARVLTKLQNEFGTKDLQVLGMAINDDANVSEFVRSFQVGFPAGKGRRDDALGILQHSVMSPFYFPGLIVIDRNGLIQAQYSGADSFLSEASQEMNLRALLRKMIPAAGGAVKPPAAKPRKKKAS